MLCSHCGTDTPAPATACRACRTPFPFAPVDADTETVAIGTGVPGGSRARTGAAPLPEGTAFGARYRILRELGTGGMGVVYQAWDAELGVAVALKVIRPDVTADPQGTLEVERRFKRELLLARQVTHKHVVRIHDLGEIDGTKYITMPYIEGQDLADVLRDRGKLPVPEVLRIAKAIAAGLVAAHEAGVIHRDLKPENIMIDQDGQPLIMDFGISRSVTTSTATATAAGAIVGTLEYMSPEQARGVAADQRADVYALGLIMHDMLAGRRRVARESALSEMMKRMQQAPPPLRAVVPDVPEAFERIVAKCLQPDPDNRYPSSAALLADLERLDPDGSLARAPLARDYRWKLATATMVVLMILSAGAAVWFARHRAAATAVPAAAHAPVSVLIADFENATGEDVFEGSLEQALGIVMEGSPFVTSYSRTSANALRAKVTKEPSLNETASRLVAVREGIKVVLAGKIARAGSGYELSLRAIDPADGKEVANAEARAKAKADVLGAVTALAGTLREKLGDTRVDNSRDAETLTVSTLDAVQAYSIAQDFAARGRHDEAIPHYQSAIKADARFGRAYSGLATSLFYVGRRDEAAKMWTEALKHMDRMTEREKFRTRGIYFLAVTQNYEKAIEEFSILVSRYPADRVGHNNLAYAYFATGDFAKAREEGRRAVELAPTNITIRTNYVLYAMYAGDFSGASSEADQVIKLDPSFYKVYLAKAIAALAEGKEDAAKEAYANMAKTDAVGASTANMGLADIAIYRGRWREAEQLLRQGIEQDRQNNNPDAVGAKLAALAETQMEQGQAAVAGRTATDALRSGHGEAIAVPAARVLARSNHAAASQLAGEFRSRLQPQQRAYGSLIEGQIALAQGQTPAAVDALRESIKSADLWQARFARAIAYVEARQWAEALSDLDECERRRGEAVAAFLDDVPTFRYLASLPYWKARAQEGAGQRAEAAKNYDAFLQLRGAGGGSLIEDAKKRRGAL